MCNGFVQTVSLNGDNKDEALGLFPVAVLSTKTVKQETNQRCCGKCSYFLPPNVSELWIGCLFLTSWVTAAFTPSIYKYCISQKRRPFLIQSRLWWTTSRWIFCQFLHSTLSPAEFANEDVWITDSIIYLFESVLFVGFNRLLVLYIGVYFN